MFDGCACPMGGSMDNSFIMKLISHIVDLQHSESHSGLIGHSIQYSLWQNLEPVHVIYWRTYSDHLSFWSVQVYSLRTEGNQICRNIL